MKNGQNLREGRRRADYQHTGNESPRRLYKNWNDIPVCDRLIDEEADKERVQHRHESRLRRRYDPSVDAAENDDRRHQRPGAVAQYLPKSLRAQFVD
ncbi:hypothetical protein SDC9_193007 [bioreactor metagenome]|uniref:Uncharacterized protein n=1 Tax=bioreactor metagenome TaxID=1076179 RepID=A0A645I2Q7_9ZZZZ